MVDKIEIVLNNGVLLQKNIQILPQKQKCNINQQEYKIETKIIEKILDILSTWQYEYGENIAIDQEEFNVTVYSSNSKTTYHGKGNYPHSYNEFLRLLGEIENGRKIN